MKFIVERKCYSGGVLWEAGQTFENDEHPLDNKGKPVRHFKRLDGPPPAPVKNKIDNDDRSTPEIKEDFRRKHPTVEFPGNMRRAQILALEDQYDRAAAQDAQED